MRLFGSQQRSRPFHVQHAGYLIGQFMTTPIAAIGQVEADNAARALFPRTSAATGKRQVYAPLKAVLNHAADKWRISVQRIKNPKVAKTAV